MMFERHMFLSYLEECLETTLLSHEDVQEKITNLTPMELTCYLGEFLEDYNEKD